MRLSSVAATATVTYPSAWTTRTVARAGPEVSRWRSLADHQGDVRRERPEQPATSPVAHTEPVCCNVIKGSATSVSRRPVQLTKVAIRMRSTSFLTPQGWRRRALPR